MNDAVPASADEVTRGFLFADLRGYTELVDAHGAIEASHLLERYRVLTREVVGRHGGAEVKTEGDSFYVVLPSASAAVRCGLALVAACASPPDGGAPIAVGVGIHAGESVAHEGGFVGSAVNITARVCTLARSGELLATATIRELTRSVVAASFVSVGRRQLKGIAGSVELFRVVATNGVPVDAPVRVSRPRSVLRPLRAWPLIGVAAIVIVMLGAIIATIRSPAPASPSPSFGGASTGSSPAPDQLFPDASEQALVARLPPSIAAGCVRGSNPAPVAEASLRCRMPSGSPPTELSLLWFSSTPNTASARITTEASDLGLPAGDCAGGTEGSGSWGGGSAPKGRLACFFDSVNEYWVEWSYDADGVLVRAVGPRTAASEVLGWWKSSVDELLAAAAPGSSSPLGRLPRLSTEFLVAPVRPGTYAPNTNQDVPSVTIVDTGWSLTADSEDILAFQIDSGDSAGSSLAVARISVVRSGPCSDDPTRLLGDRPLDLISWAQSTPQLDASEPRSVVDLGRSGIAIEATVRANPSPCPGRAPSDVRLWEVNGGSWITGPGTRMLLEALDDGPRTLTVVFAAPNADALSTFVTGPGRGLLQSMVIR